MTTEEDFDPETELPPEASVLPVPDESQWPDDKTPYDDDLVEVPETQDPETV